MSCKKPGIEPAAEALRVCRMMHDDSPGRASKIARDINLPEDICRILEEHEASSLSDLEDPKP